MCHYCDLFCMSNILEIRKHKNYAYYAYQMAQNWQNVTPTPVKKQVKCDKSWVNFHIEWPKTVDFVFIWCNLFICIKNKSCGYPYLQYTMEYCQKLRKMGNFKISDFLQNSNISTFYCTQEKSIIYIALYFS